MPDTNVSKVAGGRRLAKLSSKIGGISSPRQVVDRRQRESGARSEAVDHEIKQRLLQGLTFFLSQKITDKFLHCQYTIIITSITV